MGSVLYAKPKKEFRERWSGASLLPMPDIWDNVLYAKPEKAFWERLSGEFLVLSPADGQRIVCNTKEIISGTLVWSVFLVIPADGQRIGCKTRETKFGNACLACSSY